MLTSVTAARLLSRFHRFNFCAGYFHAQATCVGEKILSLADRQNALGFDRSEPLNNASRDKKESEIRKVSQTEAYRENV